MHVTQKRLLLEVRQRENVIPVLGKGAEVKDAH